jgi:hypothetical protein
MFFPMFFANEDEDVAQAEERLTALTQEIVPVLNQYLPK